MNNRAGAAAAAGQAPETAAIDPADEDPRSKDRRGKDDQPAREQNIDAIVAYYESGVESTRGAVGIELEHTIVHTADGSAVPYRGDHGVQWVLEQLLPFYPEQTRDAEGDLLGVARPGEAVTLEPAAQIELSAGPFPKLADAYACFEAFERRLEEALAPYGMQALAVGYHPSAAAADLSLIPKRRYKFMNLYLGAKGPFGPAMMRGSASVQVSVDYSSVADCLRKLRLAYALVPLFALMTDNAPVFEGLPRTHELVRTEIWQKCDPDRCGLVPGVMEPSFSLRQYAEYLLDTPAILMPCAKEEWCYSERTFGAIYADRPMQRSDVEHAVSMFFNDVRLKTYIELRPADAMPVPYAIAYAGIVKGLFATPENLDALDTLTDGVGAADVEAAKEALMADGYRATVYGRPVAELADAVMELAERGLEEGERRFLEPLAGLVAARETLAERAERGEPEMLPLGKSA